MAIICQPLLCGNHIVSRSTHNIQSPSTFLWLRKAKRVWHLPIYLSFIHTNLSFTPTWYKPTEIPQIHINLSHPFCLTDPQHPTHTFPLLTLFGARLICGREKMTCWRVWPRNNIIFGLKTYALVLGKCIWKSLMSHGADTWNNIFQFFRMNNTEPGSEWKPINACWLKEWVSPENLEFTTIGTA